MKEKVSELYRIFTVMSQYEHCIKENKENEFENIINRMSNIQINKIYYYDKNKIKKLLENTWLNELYLHEEVEDMYFYLKYVCFYYSLFHNISSMIRLIGIQVNEKSHKGKIHTYNFQLLKNPILKKLMVTPFNLIIDKKNNIHNFEVAHINEIKKIGKKREYIEDIIKKYDNCYKFTNLEGKIICNESKEKLSITKSTIGIIQNEKKKSKNHNNYYSILNYFMNRRHKMHYNCSFIYDEYPYDFSKKIDNAIESMKYITRAHNRYLELLLYKLDKTLLCDSYKNFKKCILNKENKENFYINDIEILLSL